MKVKLIEYPVWICATCGLKHGRHPAAGIATWHIDTCGVCGKDSVVVTEPRDFGHLKDGWEKEHEK